MKRSKRQTEKAQALLEHEQTPDDDLSVISEEWPESASNSSSDIDDIQRSDQINASKSFNPTIASRDSKKITFESVETIDADEDPESSLGRTLFHGRNYANLLALKPDHQVRPLWIDPTDRRIILEKFSPLAEQALDFLVAIAEPISRPALIHEYRLTTFSLYAAISVGLETKDIISVLERLSKTPLPPSIRSFILTCTSSYGKVKLVLRQNRYFVESPEYGVLRRLLDDPVIGPLKIIQGYDTDRDDQANQNGRVQNQSTAKFNSISSAAANSAAAAVATAETAPVSRPNWNSARSHNSNELESKTQAAREQQNIFESLAFNKNITANTVGENRTHASGKADDSTNKANTDNVNGVDEDEDDTEMDTRVHSFEIDNSSVETVKKRCTELDLPLLEEYDFRNDDRNPDLDIDLKPSTQIRPYQEKSLSKMFGNGRARSGIIVLPCGAGKTLVGITAACTIKKSVIVLCTSSVSVMQWRSQFLQWTNIRSDKIAVFTSDSKSKFEGASGIVVSTYSMVANTRHRSYESQKLMDFLTSREWGFIVLDEVHVVPAAMFRRVITTIAAHSKLGLTATLVREDNKIDDLNFLIGPKLCEANWMDLAQKGHIANVQCAEVWCPMTTEFYSEYLREKSRKRMLLYIMNPRKFQACQFLIDYHEKRGDKTIVFADNVYALQAYALKLNKYYIYGGTPQHERMRILENFQYNELVNTIFLSKVGDTSIDLPEATCLIQISSHYGSRRQEAQRLGRILRAKRRNNGGVNAFFYSLVSKDTMEMYYSTKRQAFLIDQGYAFKVITHLEGIDKLPNLAYSTKAERLELLQEVLLQNEDAANIDDGSISGGRGSASKNNNNSDNEQRTKFRRVTGALSSLGGADDMAYIEFNKSANKQLRKDYKEHHPLFRKIYAKK